MPKHICGGDLGACMRALGFIVRSRNLRRVADGSRCRETAVKTKRVRLALPPAWWPVDRAYVARGQSPDIRCSSGSLGGISRGKDDLDLTRL